MRALTIDIRLNTDALRSAANIATITVSAAATPVPAADAAAVDDAAVNAAASDASAPDVAARRDAADANAAAYYATTSDAAATSSSTNADDADDADGDDARAASQLAYAEGTWRHAHDASVAQACVHSGESRDYGACRCNAFDWWGDPLPQMANSNKRHLWTPHQHTIVRRGQCTE